MDIGQHLNKPNYAERIQSAMLPPETYITELLNELRKQIKYLLRQHGDPKLKEVKADRMPLGYYQGKDRPFTNHEIDLEPGDTFYLFSDGFIDQKGGKNNKRYMSKGFKSLLMEIQDQSMQDQKGILNKTLSDWMGSNSQTDDILIIGVRVLQHASFNMILLWDQLCKLPQSKNL